MLFAGGEWQFEGRSRRKYNLDPRFNNERHRHKRRCRRPWLRLSAKAELTLPVTEHWLAQVALLAKGRDCLLRLKPLREYRLPTLLPLLIATRHGGSSPMKKATNLTQRKRRHFTGRLLPLYILSSWKPTFALIASRCIRIENLLFHSFLPMKRIMLFDMICHRLMLFT